MSVARVTTFGARRTLPWKTTPELLPSAAVRRAGWMKGQQPQARISASIRTETSIETATGLARSGARDGAAKLTTVRPCDDKQWKSARTRWWLASVCVACVQEMCAEQPTRWCWQLHSGAKANAHSGGRVVSVLLVASSWSSVS
jgi:hypothetical protein